MVEKSFLEIQGIFLVKIRDNTFNGTIGENAVEHIEIFLKVVGPLKIKGISQDRSRLSVFPISLAGAIGEWFKKDCIGSVTTWEDLVEKFHHLSYNNDEIEAEEDDNLDDIAEIFKIEGNLFDFETPLCKAFNEFNYLLKLDTNLFTLDIQEIKTYEEYELNMTGDLEEPWTDNWVPYQLCDHICEPCHFKNGITKWPTCTSDIDGFCNGEELSGMVRVGYLTYFQDHKWYDELGDGLLKEEALIHKAKFEESWGNYGANDAGNTQDSQEHKKEHHDPSICRVRRFEMMKYSFDADDEYVAIKEHELFDHSRTNIDACQAYRELFCIMDEGWLVTKAKKE
ncbi:hypothetical protein Tco_0964281 [Tanacetum coccineum]